MKQSGLLDSPLPNESVVDRIVNRITQAIIQGELKPGDKIPTEMEMCESLQVGRNSVREAVKVLVSYGVVEIRRSEGTFVCTGFNDRMLDPMLYGLLLEQDSSHSLLELRQIFDTGVLKLAIDKVTPEDIERLKKDLQALQYEILHPDAQPERTLEADVRFHDTLTQSVRNKLVQNVADYINRMTIPSRIRTQKQILSSGDLDRYIEMHREMMDVIEHKDYASVSRVVENHYTFWRNEV